MTFTLALWFYFSLVVIAACVLFLAVMAAGGGSEEFSQSTKQAHLRAGGLKRLSGKPSSALKLSGGNFGRIAAGSCRQIGTVHETFPWDDHRWVITIGSDMTGSKPAASNPFLAASIHSPGFLRGFLGSPLIALLPPVPHRGESPLGLGCAATADLGPTLHGLSQRHAPTVPARWVDEGRALSLCVVDDCTEPRAYGSFCAVHGVDQRETKTQ